MIPFTFFGFRVDNISWGYEFFCNKVYEITYSSNNENKCFSFVKIGQSKDREILAIFMRKRIIIACSVIEIHSKVIG
ncbi:hypothetical protein A9C19_17940 [Bacillus weihaiensis]|uniref:Uncharacterized protein n=1 Tax=Bacillus weihaiensis TaxID=1547283 RepID=A0A1L3MVT7_9BACI|nr:hypothetical protein A9C19_17940 [Bacillus weihaiensis]